MIFNSRSGNFYRYDRYTHQIESIAAPAISKGGKVDVCEEKLQALSFEQITNITALPNISTSSLKLHGNATYVAAIAAIPVSILVTVYMRTRAYRQRNFL